MKETEQLGIPTGEFAPANVTHVRCLMLPEAKHQALCVNCLQDSFGLITGGGVGVGG